MARENLFQPVGTLALDDNVVAEVVLAIAGSVHDGGKCLLCTVAGT